MTEPGFTDLFEAALAKVAREMVEDDERALAAADALADAVQYGDNQGRDERLMAAMRAYRTARGDA